MLRPATPLSILLFASFVLLLISVISTPIVKGIPLARYQGVNFGVFGWCKDSGECSGVQVGWNTDEALPAGDDQQFNLPASARHSLSSLLIVHPIAAFCNLIVLGLAIAAHLHSPSHSSRYLLALLILLLPTLLVTLLAFLVDILLFVPHLQWGGWIVLGSTILITASGVVTCAMRRTLVSRKARKKRIAENAEMSGAAFYARQAEESKIAPHASTESKAPMVNGAPGADNLPAFASYNSRRSQERPMNGSMIGPDSAIGPVEDGRYYGAERSRSRSRPRQEDFSAPLGATRSIEDVPPLPNSNRSGYGPPRGGFAPRGGMPTRANFNQRGPPPSIYRGRGGYAPRGRGGYPPGPTPPGMLPPGAMMGPGMNRRPPPGYGPQGPDGTGADYGPAPVANSYPRSGEPGFEPPSPSNYGTDVNAGYGGLAYGARAQSPSRRRQSPYGSRAMSPAQGRQSPYGSRTQSLAGGRPSQDMPPAMPPMPDQFGSVAHQRSATGMDSDVLGMVEMQRVRPQMPPQRAPSGEYVAPRTNWSHGPHSPTRRSRATSGGSDYMEDVDPRFASNEPLPPIIAPSAPSHEAFHRQDSDETRGTIPSLLVPGGGHTHRHNPNSNDPSPQSSSLQITPPTTQTHAHMATTTSDPNLPHINSYENLHPGARSPVESEASHFTSVSQRPANPNWQPGNGGEFNSFAPMGMNGTRQQQRRQDMLFAGNPDFELPGMGPPRTRAMQGGRGRGVGAGYGGLGPTASMRGASPTVRGAPMPPPSAMDIAGVGGRYPTSPVPGQGPDARYAGSPVPNQGPNGGGMREI